ncbi:MAG: hypothetical protein IT317_16735 [Anaerolineales bacterium]|nr:hypothetical protein [Anaerolineales bacterium]
MKTQQTTRFAICLKSKSTDDLVVRRIYPVLPDEQAARDNYLRVVDESGEDYLYPASYFFLVELPAKIERVLRRSLPASIAQ